MKEGKLTITRDHSTNVIDIVIEDKYTGHSVTKIKVQPEEFTKALTGLGYQQCQFHMYGVPNIAPNHANLNKNFQNMLEAH